MSNQMLAIEGKCIPCPPGFKQGEDMKSCERIKCKKDEVVGGFECQKCPNYTKPDEMGFRCMMPKCGPKDIFLEDATCKKCPEY